MIKIIDNHKDAISDAKYRLKLEKNIDIYDCKHIENRYFSSIYELTGSNNSYILKISTTERTCENEYNMYVYLGEIYIESLIPVLHSIKYNYLITIKQYLVDLPKKLAISVKPDSRFELMYKLGKFLKNLQEKSGKIILFNNDEFDDYIIPRIDKIKCLNDNSKRIISTIIRKLSAKNKGKQTLESIVTDVNLGNLHLNSCNEYVLLDMGDAYRGNSYKNISTLFLSIKYGPLHQYMENKKLTNKYFHFFNEGFGGGPVNIFLFNLYQIETLICMILFIETINLLNKNTINGLLSKLSNEYLIRRYLRYMNYLLENTYDKQWH